MNGSEAILTRMPLPNKTLEATLPLFTSIWSHLLNEQLKVESPCNYETQYNALYDIV